MTRHKNRIDYPDGGWCEQELLDGQVDGWWRVYRSDGSLNWERECRDGMNHGIERHFDTSGRVNTERSYAYGSPHGTWKEILSGGEVRTIDFRHGAPLRALESPRNPEFAEGLLPLFLSAEGGANADHDDIVKRLTKATQAFFPGDSVPISSRELQSYFGLVNAMHPTETWPECEGTPLSPVLQLRAADLATEARGPINWQLMTVFAHPEYDPNETKGDFVVRMYASIDGLVTSSRATRQLCRPASVSFSSPEPSLPDKNDLPAPLAARLRRHPASAKLWASPRNLGSRIGGWPAWIQFETLPSLPSFVFQLDTLQFDEWDCGDSSIIYVFADDVDLTPTWLVSGC